MTGIIRSLIYIFIFALLLNACVLAPFGIPPTTSATPDQGFLVPTRASGGDPPFAPLHTPSAFPSPAPLSETQTANLKTRVGLGIADQADPAVWTGRLGAEWYFDWNVKDIPASSVPERWQTIRISMKNGGWACVPTQERIAGLAKKDPGHVWVVGNEPDVIWQDSLTPEIYAQAYHDLYTLLKQSDPRAQIAPAGISQATELRLAYLDRVLAEYQRRYKTYLPADWWTVHGFVLREEKGSWGVDIPPGFEQKTGMLYEVSDHGRLDLFTSQLIAFRKWMTANGYRDTPLALTEYGILMPPDLGFPPENTAKYLQQTFQWLLTASDVQTGYPRDEDRLIQRWAWFSLSDKLYPASNLADLELNQLTVIGDAFLEFTRLNP